MNLDKPYFRPKEAAVFLGVHRTYIDRQIRKFRATNGAEGIPYKKKSHNVIFIAREDLVKHIEGDA
jgi:hypothetical protein